MFGYATDETKELFPMSHLLANKLALELAKVRKEEILKWVRPDGKTQVTMEYETVNGKMIPKRVHTVLVSTQHSENVTNETIRREILENVIKPVIPQHLLDDKTIYHINPSGRFIIGGPLGVCNFKNVFIIHLGCRTNGEENYCGYIWRMGSPWWWRILRKRSIQSRSVR